nr:PfkB family carbohydrate kinase [Mangrovicoccus ximenensis]
MAPAALPIADTTGAGDCLAGWFLACRARGLGPEAALNDAVTAATLSCGSVGAQAGYPLPQDVDTCKGRETT